MRVGPTVGFVAVVQCSLMMWLGYVAGQAFGWTWLQSLYAGAAISISSTTIIVKAFEEQRIKGEFTHIVFGILIVEDLIAILLITILTNLSAGRELRRARDGMTTVGRLTGFLVLMIVVGLLTVPRLMRSIVKLRSSGDDGRRQHRHRVRFRVHRRRGRLFGRARGVHRRQPVAESGVAKTVEHLVQPVRDMFAAIFFVSVGMMIDPDRDRRRTGPGAGVHGDRRRRATCSR